VFYRASAQQQAIVLGLRGWVRNCRDGRVELLACGDAAKLEQLYKWLEIGPEYAKVTNIEVIKESQPDPVAGFEIRSTSNER